MFLPNVISDYAKRIYVKAGYDRDAALAAYPAAISEAGGDAQKLHALACLAADFAHPAALKLLFDAGVSPTDTDETFELTLLHHLARGNESKQHPKYVKPAGAVAETTELLLDQNVSVLRKNKQDQLTCYQFAAKEGLAEMVEALARRGSRLTLTDRNGNTGIHLACEQVKYAISNLERTKRELDLTLKRQAAEAERLKASGLSEAEIAQRVSGSSSKYEDQLRQQVAAAEQKIEDYFRVVKAFTEGGVDIDEKGERGTALELAISANAKKIAAYLSGNLSEGGDPAAVASGGMTLHQAAYRGDLDALEAILAGGADVNGLGDGSFEGYTALSIACAYRLVDVVAALLARGADPAFKDGNGCAAARYLLEGMSLRGVASIDAGAALKDKGSSRDAENPQLKIIRALFDAGMKVDLPIDDEGNTVLIFYCDPRWSVPWAVIDEILKRKPDLNLANLAGQTALMRVCDGSSQATEKVQLTLLERGANPDATDRNGDTALHYAARQSLNDEHQARTLCEMLLELGAKASAVNNAGKTALDIATEYYNEPLVKLLLTLM